jgi:hypothetical protein
VGVRLALLRQDFQRLGLRVTTKTKTKYYFVWTFFLHSIDNFQSELNAFYEAI